MKIILSIFLLCCLCSASPTIEEINKTLKVIDHQMTEEELFDSLGMDVPKKERSFPKIDDETQDGLFATFVLFAVAISLMITISAGPP